MNQQKRLTRTRLFEILDLYEPGVTLEMVDAYDTGTYFSFRGCAIGVVAPDARAGGRIIRQTGFCSEALVYTKDEKHSRGGRSHGDALFKARCDQRHTTLARWLQEHTASKRS